MSAPTADPRARLRAMTGLERLRALMRGELPPPTIGATMNFALIEAEEGRVRFAGAPGARHPNPMGGVHGGWVAAILDSAMGCAAHATLAAGEGYVSTDLKVNFLRGLTPETGETVAQGVVLNRGRRMAPVEGRLLAHGVSACMIFPAADAA